MTGDFDPTLSEQYRALTITFSSIVTQDAALQAVLERARCAARTDVTVLLLGENGTGKNLVAQAIHNASTRVSGPYVSLNCSAITETLLESELFGHERGAFTGAQSQKRGRFELADGGTLFLDEIGDMSQAAQAKILRAVEYREFERVGGEKTLRADVRIIAASNQPLQQRIAEGRFRQDLYYRLNEVTLEIPPLRARPGDVRLLAENFVRDSARKYKRRFDGLSDQAWSAVLAHDWPGNVRELRACIKRAAAVAQGAAIEREDLGIARALHDLTAAVLTPSLAPTAAPGDLSLAGAEARHIQGVLERAAFNKSEAARLLGITRPTLDRKIALYRLNTRPSETR